jgi:hypothetical protein
MPFTAAEISEIQDLIDNSIGNLTAELVVVEDGLDLVLSYLGEVVSNTSIDIEGLNDAIKAFNQAEAEAAGEWPPKDTLPPDQITDLAASPVNSTTIRLAWTVPSDNSGTITSYTIRYSTSNILTPSDFDSATNVASPPAPSAVGVAQTFNIAFLTAGTLYYFAIKSTDPDGNESVQSNTASATTDST